MSKRDFEYSILNNKTNTIIEGAGSTSAPMVNGTLLKPFGLRMITSKYENLAVWRKGHDQKMTQSDLIGTSLPILVDKTDLIDQSN